ncbi:MAG: hypothetical protein H6R02_194 [Burkholderiaceae bacterium]|jgi:hypothetical protein|nr:hypothetical protein [Burkholderiaceae bacterium]
MQRTTRQIVSQVGTSLVLLALCATAWPQSSDTAADQLKAQKDLAELQKSVFEAQKAQYEAQLAAAKAKFGDLPASGIGGTADLATGAGTAEGLLLGTKTVNEIADAFVCDILLKAEPAKFVLSTTSAIPDFQLLIAFEAQHTAMAAAVKQAEISTGSEERAVRESPALAAALPFVSNLLSYAKTDYKFIGFDVTTSDAMLLRAMAGKLVAKGRTVSIPAVYYLPQASQSSLSLLSKIGDLDTWSIKAKKLLLLYGDEKKQIEKDLTKTPNDEALKKQSDRLQLNIATWQAVSDAIDAWSKKLIAPDDKGTSAIATIVRQGAIKQPLDAGAGLLVVELHKVSATGYSKKNLWSSLGANPFFVMGGAVASYVLVNGKTGEVLSAQLLPHSGAYLSVSEVEQQVNSAKQQDCPKPEIAQKK